MSGSIVIGAREIDTLRDSLRRASEASLSGMLDEIGQTLEDSARDRISQNKQGPSGKRWAPWSQDYAATRGAQHSLLRGSGDLLDSLTHEVDVQSATVFVGSNLIYAGRHLFGDDGAAGPGRGGRIPARPYLDTDGQISDSRDRQEIRDIVRDFMRGVLP